MKVVLDYLIANAPEGNDGVVEIQIIMRTGAQFAGAAKKSELGDDIYEMLTIGQTPQQQPIAVTIYFKVEDILSIQVAEHKEKSSILTPRGVGITIPS